MWSDKYDPAREGVPVPADAYVSPGPPPWEQPPRMTWPGRIAVGVVALAAAAMLVTSTIKVWKVVDAIIAAL